MSDPNAVVEDAVEQVPSEVPIEINKLSTTSTATKVSIKEPLTLFSDEAYACDRQYAIVLAQLISIGDREKVYKWIERYDQFLVDSH